MSGFETSGSVVVHSESAEPPFKPPFDSRIPTSLWIKCFFQVISSEDGYSHSLFAIVKVTFIKGTLQRTSIEDTSLLSHWRRGGRFIVDGMIPGFKSRQLTLFYRNFRKRKEGNRER